MDYVIKERSDAEVVAVIIKELPFEFTPYAVKIEIIKNNRSNNQNRYYWGVVLKYISNNTGSTPEELHDVFKPMFLKEFISFNGSEVERVKDTKRLTTLEFEAYLTKIRTFASAELGVFIPLPNEVIY